MDGKPFSLMLLKCPSLLKKRNSEYIYFKGKGGEAWVSPLKVLHLEIEAGNITLQRVMVMVMVMVMR